MKDYKQRVAGQTAIWVLILMFVTGVCLFCMFLPSVLRHRTDIQDKDAVRNTVRTVVVDTVTWYKPVVKDSIVVKWVTRVLPTKDTILTENYAQKVSDIIHDSVTVELPITQKTYETEDYKAWVSGYEPRLDSISVFRKNVTERIIVKEKARMFGVGIVGGVGYGMTGKKADVFVGVGGYVRIF